MVNILAEKDCQGWQSERVNGKRNLGRKESRNKKRIEKRRGPPSSNIARYGIIREEKTEKRKLKAKGKRVDGIN